MKSICSSFINLLFTLAHIIKALGTMFVLPRNCIFVLSIHFEEVHQALVLHPSCVPEKVDSNEKSINQK